MIIEQRISEGQKLPLNTRVDVRIPSKHSRYGHKSAQKYETKKYVTYTEKFCISKMGDVQIVFSRKAKATALKSLMKYIATDMLSLTTNQILTIYSYRWLIERYHFVLKRSLLVWSGEAATGDSRKTSLRFGNILKRKLYSSLAFAMAYIRSP